jgi:hypothetical protein
MKHTILILSQSLGVAFALSTSAQGTFQNLNFEDATPGLVPGNVSAASALPDWSVYYGGVQQTSITYDAPGLGSTEATLIGPGVPAVASFIIDGNYSLLLQGGGTASAASISQSGTIPSGAESLLFKAQPGEGTLDVLLGNQVVPFTAVGTGANYTLYAANVSAWSGDTESLTFSALQDLAGPNNWTIDDISFSTSVVPEPGPLALTAIGGLLFALYRRFAPKYR